MKIIRRRVASISKLADTQKTTMQTMTVDNLDSKKVIKRFKKTKFAYLKILICKSNDRQYS